MMEVNRELLNKRIKQSGKTRAELANEADLSINTVYNVTSGRTQPSYFATKSICRALQLTQEDIMNIFFCGVLTLHRDPLT